MPEAYTYEIAVADGDVWRVTQADELHPVLDRDAKETARAVLEDWLLTHPGDVEGGERLEVFGRNTRDYPPDALTQVRVWVYRGPLEAREVEPAAAAYLVTEPDDLQTADLDLTL